MKLKKIIKSFNEIIDNNFLVLFLFLVFIGLTRSRLELMFYGKTNQDFGYTLTISGLSNTITYVFLMVIAEGYIINLLFSGDRKKLRLLIQKGSQFLLGLFILIPILNNIFNYYFFNLPIFYNLKTIHPALSPHYGPVGINVAFLIVLFVFPLWLKKIYRSTLLKAFKIVLLVYSIHYIITYQLLMSFCFGGYFSAFNPFKEVIFPINMYSIGFTLITLFIYPFFLEKYPKSKNEFYQVAMIYFILWGVVFFLFFINPSFSSFWFPRGFF